MPVDVYGPCPCGSGKKLKFCCHAIVDEMEKIETLCANNQIRMALQALEGLEKSHPGAPWTAIWRAQILHDEGTPEAAKEILEGLLQKQPEHPLANVLYGAAALETDGYDAARPAIHRALQRGSGLLPELVSSLTLGIAAFMLGRNRAMAARQFLTLAMRTARDEDRQEVFLRLLQFDSDSRIPYPLRSVHELADSSGSPDAEKECVKAVRLAYIGCYQPAARLFAKLAEQDADNPNLWLNIGLCRAWDGDEPRAAEALHRAARLYEDRETAVECETLAQLLELNSSEDAVRLIAVSYHVSSVARLLGRLTEHERLVRLEIEPPQEEEAEIEQPAARFHIRDRGPVEGPLTLETVAHILGETEIHDAPLDSEEPAKLFLMAFEGEPLETSRQVLEETAGDLIEAIPVEDENELVIDDIAREQYPLHWRWSFLREKPSVLHRRELSRQRWEQVVTELWPSIPQSALGGRTPREAVGDPELKVPLAAAVFVLDAYCDRNKHSLDLTRQFERFDLEPPRPIEVAPDTPLNSFSVMQLHRLPVEQLSDAQLTYVLNRALLLHHGGFLYRVLKEVIGRPSCTEKVDLNRVYATLVELCRDQYRRDEAFEWVERGKQHAQTQENPFEQLLGWEIRELGLRLEDPQDPNLPPLLMRLHDYYGRKLPQLQSYVQGLLDLYEITPPWQSREGVASAEAAATTAGGLWTPTGEAGTAGEKKLWIPGQQ